MPTTGGAMPMSTGGPGGGGGPTGDTGAEEEGNGEGDTDGPPGPGTSVTTGASETTGGSTGADTEAPVGFAVDIWPIFDDACGCHQGDNGAGKLVLTEQDAYANLVGVPSDDIPEMMLVAPGMPEVSYLWHKLNDTRTRSTARASGCRPRACCR